MPHIRTIVAYYNIQRFQTATFVMYLVLLLRGVSPYQVLCGGCLGVVEMMWCRRSVVIFRVCKPMKPIGLAMHVTCPLCVYVRVRLDYVCVCLCVRDRQTDRQTVCASTLCCVSHLVEEPQCNLIL